MQPSRVASLASFAALLLPATALAAPPGAEGAQVRVHAETDFFSFQSFDPDGDPDPINSFGFGLNRVNSLAAGDGLGFPRPLASIGVGYVFPNNQAILGGRFGFSVDSGDRTRDDDNDTTAATGLIQPYFRWMFIPGGWARPYVEARLGFGGGHVKRNIREDNGEGYVLNRTIGPTVGVGGGASFFPVKFFSIDLGLNFDYRAPHVMRRQEIRAGGVTVSNRDPESGWDKAGDFIVLAIVLGISVWI